MCRAFAAERILCMDKPYVLKEGTPEYVGSILSALESQGMVNEAWERMFDAYKDEIDKLWTDNAALRGELHAVANRVEGLVRAVTANPADVAAKIVNEANRATLREVKE